MTTSKSGAMTSAWESGLDFSTPPRTAHDAKATKRRRVVDARQSMTMARVPRTRRGSPPPLEDDIDVLGGLLLVLMFLAIVWL